MKTGITIVTYERSERMLRTVLDRIYAFSGKNIEVAVVSNSKSEEAKDRERSLQKEYGFILLRGSTIYFLAAKNIGTNYHLRSCDYFVEMDDDIFVTPDWLDRMIEVVKADKTIGLVVPLLNFGPAIWYRKQVVELPSTVEDYRRAEIAEEKCNIEVLNDFWQKEFKPKSSNWVEVKNFEMSLCLRPRDVVERGCVWDDRLIFGGNTILFRQLQRIGKKSVVAKNVYCFHLQTSTLSTERRKDEDLFWKNHKECCEYIAGKYGSLENIFEKEDDEDRDIFISTPTSWSIYQEHARENLM